MGATTEISWADATFNAWWGCTEVSPACDHCYARTLANRWGFDIWGNDKPRRFFGPKHFQEPLKWNREAEAEGRRRRVFCGSMCDWAEELPPTHPDVTQMNDARARLFGLIYATPWLDWMLLTKRPQAAPRVTPPTWREAWPRNVWALTTVENQEQAEKRLPHLLKIPAVVRGISAEPLLGPVNLHPWVGHWIGTDEIEAPPVVVGARSFPRRIVVPKLHWIITGGESGHAPRPTHPDWVRGLRDQAVAAGIAFHHKQWGEWGPVFADAGRPGGTCLANFTFPDGQSMWRLGKKAAGRQLDGRTWDEFPALCGGAGRRGVGA